MLQTVDLKQNYVSASLVRFGKFRCDSHDDDAARDSRVLGNQIRALGTW